MQPNFSKPILGLGLCLVLASSVSCGKKSSDTPAAAAETSIKLTGTLALTGEATTLGLTSTAVTDLSVYCVSLAVPPVAGTGTIASDGSFSVTLETAGVSVGCFILDAAKAIVGTMVFEDTATKDLNGASKSADKFALEGGASNLGAITLNLSTGKAVVDVAKIVGKPKDTTAALTSAYDFTGTYVFGASGQDAPEGYANLCTREEQEASRGPNGNVAGVKKCNGPSLDMPIYMKRIAGVATGSTTPRFAMAFWASKAADAACGSRLGVSLADAKDHGIDFTNSGVTPGEFAWSAGYEDGWKDTANAKVQHALMKQDRVDNFKGYPGTKQYFKQYHTLTCGQNGCSDGTIVTAAGFMFNADSNESGCKNTATGAPVRLDDWRDMKCTNTPVGEGLVLHKNVCTKDYLGANVTCTNIGGTFNADGTELQSAAVRYPDDFVVLANPNELCSTIATTTDEGKLAQLRCYADNRGGQGGNGDGTTCSRDVRTNWNAKTPAEFVSTGKSKPKGQFVFELLDYDTATSASIRGEEHDYRGIRVGDNFTDCEFINVFSFSMKKIGDTKDLQGEMIQTSTNVSTKPACIAANPADKPTKSLFKLTRQAD